MKTEKRVYPPIQIGVSFMLVIFLILCMVTFAALSLSSAQKDYEYSLKNADRISAYYKASNLAEEKLAEIDHTLASGQDAEEEFLIPINDSEALHVILEFDSQKSSGYTITSWKQIATDDWTGNEQLPVLGGSSY